ncbi:unnamed protein product [Auanema sp. JU1783]|nr:unnamed protein product [Auanema sp. JU1783]
MQKSKERPAKKILVLGPCKAGKSAISTYLAEAIDSESLGEYRPTKGVRIVEFESNELDIRGQRAEVDVELWDCSGDVRYRDCWPALKDGVEGVILVADPDVDKGEDLLIWYEEFIQKTNLRNDNVMVVLNEKGDKNTNSGNIAAFKVIAGLSPAVFVGCNLRHEGEHLKQVFYQFLVNVIQRSDDNSIFSGQILDDN